MGSHRVRANVYLAAADRFFDSPATAFDLTDGKLYWRQTVGVPGSTGDMRQVSLLTNRLPDKLLLYVRIRDDVGSTVYTTQSLGRMILGGRDPEEMLDRENNLHVLQEAQPGGFLYTEVGLDGTRLVQKAYVKVGPSHPFLAKTPSGDVIVRGGQVQVAPAAPTGGIAGPVAQPKLSDRPTWSAGHSQGPLRPVRPASLYGLFAQGALLPVRTGDGLPRTLRFDARGSSVTILPHAAHRGSLSVNRFVGLRHDSGGRGMVVRSGDGSRRRAAGI